MTFGEIANSLADDPVVTRYGFAGFPQVSQQLRARLANRLALVGNLVILEVGVPLAEAADDEAVVSRAGVEPRQQLPAAALEGGLPVARAVGNLRRIGACLLAVGSGKELR